MPSPTDIAYKVRQIGKGAAACELSAKVMYEGKDEAAAAQYIELARNLWDAAFCLTLSEPIILNIGVVDGESTVS